MEWLVIGLFCASLFLCVFLDISVLYALVFGLALFLLYGRLRGHALSSLLRAALSGMASVRSILFVFALIGMLTALWRAAGTIPVIVCHAALLIRPAVFLLMTFLLCSGVSFLTGSSFATAATMGVVCAAMGSALGADPRLTGGAVLSGAFFGDRCSPVSTSALLVATLTHTDIFGNIRQMIRTAFLPFLLTCALLAAAGVRIRADGEVPDLFTQFGTSFRLHPLAFIPAALILVLSALRIPVKQTMALSILSAVPLCFFLQGMPAGEIVRTAIFGFHPTNPDVALLSGGGITSMLRVGGIVCLSSSYAGIFRLTGLLHTMKDGVRHLSERASSYAAVLAASIPTAMAACNQTLAILLTHELAEGLLSDEDLALDLEDSAVIVSPLVPWSIAGTTPLSIIGSPLSSIPFAFYLILLPITRLIFSLFGRKKQEAKSERRVS